MAFITKSTSGARPASRSDERAALLRETARSRDEAPRWARQAETRVDRGLAATTASVSRLQSFGTLSGRQITDMCEIGNPLEGLGMLRLPRAVIAGGRVYDGFALDALYVHVIATAIEASVFQRQCITSTNSR